MCRNRMVRVHLLIGLFFAISPSLANPVPDDTLLFSKPEMWDNLNGTAGEPLSLYDVYLAAPQKFRVAILFDPLATSDGWDSTGKIHHINYEYYRPYQLEYKYSRINLPVSIAYGIAQSWEIELRRAFVTRSNAIGYTAESLLVPQPWHELTGTTKGFSDFSLRFRTKILGAQNKPIYLAAGIGLKLASSTEFDTAYQLPISPGSTDLFFGIYNAIKFSRFIIPSAITYSHTGRYLNSLRMGEIITYRIGLIAAINQLVDLNLSLRGFEITEESKSSNSPTSISLATGVTDKIIDFSPQGISKTTAEFGLTTKLSGLRTILFGGLVADVRGRRTFNNGIATTFSLQIEF